MRGGLPPSSQQERAQARAMAEQSDPQHPQKVHDALMRIVIGEGGGAVGAWDRQQRLRREARLQAQEALRAERELNNAEIDLGPVRLPPPLDVDDEDEEWDDDDDE